MRNRIALSVCFLLSASAWLSHAAEPPMAPKSGINLAAMDPSINPGDDFFLYANGTWIKKNPIPAAYSYWGNFSELHDRNQNILRTILDDLHNVPDASLDADGRKLRDFYDTAMDEAKLERNGITPLAPEFDRIKHITSRDDLLATILHLHEIGAEPLYDASVNVDEKHSDRYSLHLWQSGQGLPERDYYLDTPKDKMYRSPQNRAAVW